MSKMTNTELCSITDYMVANSATDSGTFTGQNERWLKYYNANYFGDEVDGRSKVVSPDVRDLVESDMASLVRVFLGAGDPVEFKPVGVSAEAIKEARDKQAVVSHIIRSIKDSFRTQHDWLKASEFQSISPLEYGVVEEEVTTTAKYRDKTEEELKAIVQDIESDADVIDVNVSEIEDEEGLYSAALVIKRKRQRYFMNCVPVEDFIVSRNAWNKADAECIGKRFRKRRGELVAEGFSKDRVDQLPSMSDETDRSTLKATRYEDQGGEDYADSSYLQWANQEVEGVDVYALVDYDNDGIAERRHIVKVGDQVLENEAVDHVPYALASSMLMPSNIMGVPRAELVREYQRINSVMWRQTLDNIYQVNMPRWAYNDDVDIDSLLDHQFGGAVYVEGQPAAALMPLQTPYIGDKALQVIQYMEGKKAMSAGSAIANQALEADQLHKETATRFKGVDDAQKARIELVARVIAEVGYRDLWEGIAWFASQYQDTEMEVQILGRPMTVNPKSWKYDHYVCSKVGAGAGDDTKKMQNMTGLLQIQTALQQASNPMVDNSKLYKTLTEIVQAAGEDAVGEFFNNPEIPADVAQAELELLRRTVPQLQAQASQQNMLAEAENVKGQYELQLKQMQQKFDAQLEMVKMDNKNRDDLTKLRADFEKQLQDIQFKYTKLFSDRRYDYTKLELENNTDIPGEGVNDRPGKAKQNDLGERIEEEPSAQ